MRVHHLVVMVTLACLLVTCGQPQAVPNTQSADPTSTIQHVNAGHSESSYITVRSLKERIAREPVVVIGQITGTGEVINMARDIYDNTKPAPDLFGVGQVYTFKVQRYLKGTGPNELNVANPEGLISADPATVTAADIQRAKEDSGYGNEAFQIGATYLLLLHRLDGFDPSHNYFTGGIHPWRFVVASAGNLTMEAPGGVFSQLPADFIPHPDAPLLPQVEQIIREQQTATP